jgi:UDP-N-acetylglucosamine acyltransferase
MSDNASARIHPTAIVSSEVRLGANVQIGAYAVLEGRIDIGDDCVIRPGAYLYGPMKLGRGNLVCTGAVLGEAPQHLRYKGEETSLEIGDGNLFREHVTVHRGTTHSMKTVIGNNNFFMVGGHVGHDARIGNRCILTNGCLVAGHCTLEDSVILSGNAAIHQFVRVGRLALISGLSASTKDVPPFIVQQNIDVVYGVNVIGMKRAGMNHAQVDAVREMFKMIFREGLTLPSAIAKGEAKLGHVDVVQEMITFLRGCKKGICMMRSHIRQDAA